MKQLIVCAAVVALWLSGGPGFAQEKPVASTEITIKAGGEEFKAYVATPDGKGPFPGVVVIQEWWGLNDWIKENAQHLAKKGFVAIAPDLYHGKVATDPKEASQLMGGLPKDRALRDLKAAVDKLKPLQAKVLGIFGEEDKGIKAADVRTFEQALKTAGKSVEKINIYPGAGHGFMRPPSTSLKN